ncbi:MAG: acyl-CoA thioesterase [Myxococcales bacterium]|nr:MAG: acyl-CoA thioesterase [Myxococcales bacterium]
MSADKQFKHKVRVGYVDTDQGGVVHHTAYVRYLEAARIEYLRAFGVSYKEFEIDAKLALPVVEARVRYRRPAYFDDELEIQIWVGEFSKARLRFDSKIYRGDELLNEGEITLACVRTDTGRPTSMPQIIIDACSN